MATSDGEWSDALRTCRSWGGPRWFVLCVAFLLVFDLLVLGRWRGGEMLTRLLPPSLQSIGTIAVDSTVHSLLSVAIWRATCELFVNGSAFRNGVADGIPRIALLDGSGYWVGNAAAYLLAAVVDIDHFVAGGFPPSLHAATHLSSRKGLVMHNVLFVSCLVFALHLCSCQPERVCLCATSIFSHILRDETRTGLLLYPFGKTGPLPYGVFVLSVLAMPKIAVAYLRWSLGLSRGEGDNDRGGWVGMNVV